MTSSDLAQRLPNEREIGQASAAMELLSKSLKPSGVLPLSVRQNDETIEIALEPSIGKMVIELLGHVARGEMVTLVPYGADLTTQKAADLLNVSRPHLTKLLTGGEIPFHKVGSHRRIKARDLMAFKAGRDARRSDALDRLQALGQDFENP
tara:strand:- start:879 stop:1331 length:453 start_codon:yes stop_codon:yes gene_type:complete